jgi:hypothetical protein
MPTRLTLRSELLALRAEDSRVRTELSQGGKLVDGYEPEMEAIHRKNAARMRQIIAQYGWPTRTLVGVDGEEAAWLIVQHSIGEPKLLRGAVPLLRKAVGAGEAPAWQLAYLTDRIAFFEGRPQRYGTQFEYDDHGHEVVYRLEDPARVAELRKSVRLSPLGEEVPPNERQIPMDPEKLRRYRAAFEAWAKEVGWRK